MRCGSPPSQRRNSGFVIYGLASVMFCGTVRTQQISDADGYSALSEIVVTAQRYAQNLQSVPISITALDAERVASLQIADLSGFVKLIPSLTIQSEGPGHSHLFMRGIANTNEFTNGGTQPSVAIYVDDMPVTTLDGNLDIHTYDIARVEALAGPQGTLFGASSLAGTIRYVTNAPDPKRFAAAYDVAGTTFPEGSAGDKLEGFVNVPVGTRAAIRLVGYQEHDGGYINNILGPPEIFPTSHLPHTNASLVHSHFNEVNTRGGRAAIRIELNERWTVNAGVLGQHAVTDGEFGYTPELGDLSVARYLPDRYADQWWIGTLKVAGRIGILETRVDAGYLRRHTDLLLDASGNSYFNDLANPGIFGLLFTDNQGNLIDPSVLYASNDSYATQAQELRIATPASARLRFTAGLFAERQAHRARFEGRTAGLADRYSISNLPGVGYLDSEIDTNRDRAAFLDGSYDLTSQLTLTAGVRRFGYDNTAYGFNGYNGQPTGFGFAFAGGESTCFTGTVTSSREWPCVNINSRTTRSGETHRAIVTYHFDPQRLVYTTWSTGYRPGGTNIVPGTPAYAPDYVSNIELGWKTHWLQGRLRFNGALFLERWKDTQLAVSGPDGIGLIINTGHAESRGIESDLAWRVTGSLTLSASAAFTDARLKSNVCVFPSPSQTCTEPNVVHDANGNLLGVNPNTVLAFAGWRLPSSPRFKGDLLARQEFDLLGGRGYLQASVSGQTNAPSDLNIFVNRGEPNVPGFASVDLSIGLKRDSWRAELFVHNLFDSRGEVGGRATECDPSVCTRLYVVPMAPRLIGFTFGQSF